MSKKVSKNYNVRADYALINQVQKIIKEQTGLTVNKPEAVNSALRYYIQGAK